MAQLSQAKRIVVKVGTSTITHDNGTPNIRGLDHLCRVLSDLVSTGMQVVLVTSGAVGIGVGKMGLAERPSDIAGRQAMAALGQCELMFLYDKLFGEYGRRCAQVLLTGDIVNYEQRKTHFINCINALLELSIIPIINENDAVAVEELEGVNIGDNDNLSAIVSLLIKADSLVMLTDIDGLYDRDPNSSGAVRIPVVLEITDSIKAVAGGRGSKRGTGGMATKIAAAERACEAGIDTYIISGSRPEALYDLIEGQSIGTHFIPKRQ